jgi:hypothetical protein
VLREQFRVVRRRPPLAAVAAWWRRRAAREPWATEGRQPLRRADRAHVPLAGRIELEVRHRSNDLMMLIALVADGQAVTLLLDLVGAERDPAVARARHRRGRLERTVFGDPARRARRPARSRCWAALKAEADARLDSNMSEALLLVDDDAPIRRMLARTSPPRLRRRGGRGRRRALAAVERNAGRDRARRGDARRRRVR